jgi:biotin transport system substrate-specific component
MQLAPTRPTLIDSLIPGKSLTKDIALIVGFSLLVTVFAQIAIRLPFTPVPITGQTLAVLLTGGALGANRGAASLALYLLMGTVGLPFFAPSGAALEGELIHFIFPWEGTGAAFWTLTSGGYVVGFIAAAYVVGRLAERGWDRGWNVTVAMLLGNVLVYVPGLLWLAYKIDSFDNALVFGLYPFIVGDLIKLYIAAVALPGAWALIGRKR